MRTKGLNFIVVLPSDGNSQLFSQRESGVTHTPYEIEAIFYSLIRSGDVKKVSESLDSFFDNGIVVGRLALDNLRQIQYWAVCCITLATRYAIQGGLNETDAFNLSDKYIRSIDKLTTQEQIIAFLAEKAIELTEKVNLSHCKLEYPNAISDCINYIYKNLHTKLTVPLLAEYCCLSPDYLSALFKKTVGINLHSYILKQKLEAAKTMLNGKYEYSSIGYYLGFSSESHFIASFKKQFGVTPKQYAKSLRY